MVSRQLCLLLNAEDIYRCCAETLQQEEDHKFASHMIMTLSTILLTATELFELRTQLKDLKTDVSPHSVNETNWSLFYTESAMHDNY